MKEIKIQKTLYSKIDQVDFNHLGFGKFYSDHMLFCEYENGHWQNPIIKPFENISFSPATSVFHYSQSIFEGMKAYKNSENQIFLFRAEENFKRFNQSALRLNMPPIEKEIFIEGLKKLINLDRKWIPGQEGQSLYIRPFMIASEELLRAVPSQKYFFMIICSPSGAYYNEPLKLKIEDKYNRAVEKMGFVKTGSNYASCFYPKKLAEDKGYNEILWLDSSLKFVSESGAMNIFFLIEDKLITPEVDGNILKGITRNSLIELAKKRKNELSLRDIKEEKVSLYDLLKALRENKIKEAFGSGTAVITNSIESISYKGENFQLPMLKEEEKLAFKLKKQLLDIQYGNAKDEFGWRIQL